MSKSQISAETKTDKILKWVKNNIIIAIAIVFCITILATEKVISAVDTIARVTGLRKSYDVTENTERGRFSSALLENAWNRMFWMRVYTERVRVGAPKEEQLRAWQKYIDATEKWSSNIMNYLLGLEQYYPGSDKRSFLEDTIQPKLIEIGQMIRALKYPVDSISHNIVGPKIDSIQGKVDDVNNDFYSLIDQPNNPSKRNQ